MDQETSQPLIPCVFCNHLNTAGHRFCGMCGKALPDPSRKVVKPTIPSIPGPSSATPLRGIGGGPRPEPDIPARPIAPIPLESMRPGALGSNPDPHPHPPSQAAAPPDATASAIPPRPPAAPSRTSHQEDMNRDLSYLLEDTHEPPKPSRLPFILAGLLLAAVAGFFAMRSGSKTPTPTTDETASVSEPAAEKAKPPATESRPKQDKSAAVSEPSATDSGASDNTSRAEPEAKSPETAIDEAKPAATDAVRPPKTVAPLKTRPAVAPKPARTAAARKPSPSKQAADPPAEAPESDASVAASSDCDKVPALRKAADRGDIKARTSLGLVYYSGQCVPRDLPTAYRWYALALRANPDNTQLSAQLEAIWKQMSPAERQLAIRPQP